LRAVIAAALLALAVAGCASKSTDIAASYVSPLQYESLTCPQLAEEAQRVSHRPAVAAGVQDQKATNDAVATTVGAIMFWPAPFFIGGELLASFDPQWPVLIPLWNQQGIGKLTSC
jgi:hypothetical protein